jgi:hypothetical protein
MIEQAVPPLSPPRGSAEWRRRNAAQLADARRAKKLRREKVMRANEHRSLVLHKRWKQLYKMSLQKLHDEIEEAKKELALRADEEFAQCSEEEEPEPSGIIAWRQRFARRLLGEHIPFTREDYAYGLHIKHIAGITGFKQIYKMVNGAVPSDSAISKVFHQETIAIQTEIVSCDGAPDLAKRVMKGIAPEAREKFWRNLEELTKEEQAEEVAINARISEGRPGEHPLTYEMFVSLCGMIPNFDHLLCLARTIASAARDVSMLNEAEERLRKMAADFGEKAAAVDPLVTRADDGWRSFLGQVLPRDIGDHSLVARET